MELEIIREYCLSLPGVTEKVQWEDNLLFSVGGKMFVIYNMGIESTDRVSLKCKPEKFHELIESENIIPAPYLARNNWICIQDGCRLKLKEMMELISESYDLVYGKLPAKLRKQISESA